MEAESDSRDVVDTVSAPVDAAGGEEEAVSPAAVAEETTPVEPPLAEPATAATAEAAAEVPTAEEVPAAAEPVEEESDAAPGEAATPVTEVPEDVTADAQAPPAPAAAPAPAPAAAPAPAPAAAPAPAPAAAAAAPPTEVVEETATTAEVAAAAPAPDVVSPVHPNTDGASDVVHVSVDKGGSSDDRVTQSDRGLADDDAAEALPTETVTGDAAAAVDGAPPPPPSGGAAAPVVDAAVPKSADAPAPTREPHSASQQQQQQRRPESPAPQQQQQQQHPHRVAAVLHRVGSPSATSAMPPYTSVAAAADGAYDMSEADRIAVAAASLTPNTALSIFRRGRENSHVNRMEIGSYSRYLLSTDHMPPVVLDSTFHGEEPTVGAVPRNTLNASGRGHVGGGHTTADGAVGATTATLDREQVSPRAATASSSVRRTYHSPRPTSAATAASRAADQAVSGTFAGTAASSTNLRRELAMLGDVHLSDLNTTRQLRRRDPRHGKSAEEQHDHIYYNHHSKGYYVPHDPPADTTMLHYNHLYAFGDGTRFTAASNGASTNTATTTITHSHHPRAAPPRSFAETRGSAFPFTATQRQLYGTHHVGGGAAAATATQRSRAATSASSALGGRGAPAITGSSSLRTAKAVDLNRLHTTQCSRPRSIEEVMADQPQRYLCGPDGVRGPLVHDIERDVEDGKLEWGDVPPAMRKAMAAATTAATAAAHRSQPTSAAGLPASASSAAGRRQQRGGSLSMAPNALGSVMGQVRTVSAIAAATGGVPATRGGAAAAKTLTTAPPSPAAAAAAAAARSPSAERGGGSATGAARRVPVGSSTAAAALPAISRLAYTPRPTPRSNPSAFV